MGEYFVDFIVCDICFERNISNDVDVEYVSTVSLLYEHANIKIIISWLYDMTLAYEAYGAL